MQGEPLSVTTSSEMSEPEKSITSIKESEPE
jgi:hypothetical protein